jgi:hypothetical protein
MPIEESIEETKPQTMSEEPQTMSEAKPILLPTEIMLQILGYALDLPNGIHSDRWDFIKKVRVDKLSAINQQYPDVVSEALYKQNKVIIKCLHPKKFHGTNRNAIITYPTVQQSQFVRELEFVTNAIHGDEEDQEPFLQCQVSWLNNLASGVLGFEKLDMLRLVFKIPEREEFLSRMIELLTAIGPLYFKTKKLEIVFHNCKGPGPDCTCGDDWSEEHEMLCSFLLMQPPE